MASPEEIADLLPDTLPEDFGDWDGNRSATVAPDAPGGPQVVPPPAEPSKPGEQASLRGAGVALGVGRPRGMQSSWSDPEALSRPEPRRRQEDGLNRSTSSRLESGRPLGDPRQAPERETRPASTVEWPQGPSSGPTAATLLREKLAVETTERAPQRSGHRVEPRQAPSERLGASAVPSPVKPVERAAPSDPRGGMSDTALVDLFRETVEEAAEEKPARKKQIVLAAVGSGALLVGLLLIPVLHRGSKAEATTRPNTTSAAVTEAPQSANTLKPQAGRSSAARAGASAAAQPDTGSDGENADDQADQPTQPTAGAAMMNAQLTAQSRISQDARTTASASAPPPVSMNADAMGGSSPNSSIFNSQGQPVVHAAPAKPIAVSAGVANGMLIQKKTPQYPELAKQARIGGTVVLSALISKTGTVTNLQVISGPQMLRQAALDAVRTWRYKPYQLNNQPIEMQTTINLVFTLGG